MPRSSKKLSSRNRILWLAVCGFAGLALFFATNSNWLWPKGRAPAQFLPSQRKLLESRKSLYNNIYFFSEGRNGAMPFGYNRRIYTESIFNTEDDRDLPVAYTRYM